jgi:hypothetical protein
VTFGGLFALAPAELSEGDDPFSMFGGWDSGQLLWLAILVPVAVLVFSVGSRRVRAQLGRAAILPRGRDRSAPGHGHQRDEAWRTAIERLEARAPTPIAEAPSGLVRIEGVITGSTGNLGGAPGRECVWRNRAGAGPQTAVATELLFVADPSGRCGVEELEQARVIAPVDKVGAHYESTSLRIGDRVEVIGRFEREVLGEDEDPTRLVYGTLGGDGRLDVRVLERPSPEPNAAEPHPEPEAAAPDAAPSEPAQAEAAAPVGTAKAPAEAMASTSFTELPTRPDYPPIRGDATAMVGSPRAPEQPEPPEHEP